MSLFRFLAFLYIALASQPRAIPFYIPRGVLNNGDSLALLYLCHFRVELVIPHQGGTAEQKNRTNTPVHNSITQKTALAKGQEACHISTRIMRQTLSKLAFVAFSSLPSSTSFSHSSYSQSSLSSALHAEASASTVPAAIKPIEEGSHDELMYALGVNLARQRKPHYACLSSTLP